MDDGVFDYTPAIALPVSHPVGLVITTPCGTFTDEIRNFLLDIYASCNLQGIGESNAPFITIVFSCGGQFSVDSINDFPETNVPCTCGDPDGYFIKYESSEITDQITEPRLGLFSAKAIQLGGIRSDLDRETIDVDDLDVLFAQIDEALEEN